MKTIKYILSISLLSLFFITFSCQDDNATFGDIVNPSNLVLTAEIIGQDALNPNGDGSGLVNFQVTGDNVLNYNFNFGDNISEAVPSGQTTHRYSIVGNNTYNVIVNAIGTGGVASSVTLSIDVFSSFDDQEAKDFLSGGSGNSKTWYWAASEPAHLGVGPANAGVDPNGFWWPVWYAAAPFEKDGDVMSECIYEDEFIFSLDASNQLTYVLNNNGETYFNGAHSAVGGGTGSGDDICLVYDTSGSSIVSLSPTSEDWASVPDPAFTSRGTVMNFTGNNFMGYYAGSSTYEILELTNTRMVVRTYDGLNPDLAWYHTFSSSAPSQGFTSNYNTLVWADEFDVDGAPDPTKWTYDLGAGGWGNGESQTYTSNADNVIVAGDMLKITAKANGSGYTSARLKSENLYEFTYGRVEVRAKLPASAGTWPAIWMLGANFDTVSWPHCGEIDIMEQTGSNKNDILGTCHWFDNGSSTNASYGETKTITTSTSEFHNYTVEWSATAIQILVDDVVYYTLANTSTLPFNADFFMILNVAMGGTLGGTIDPAFTEDSMEIDYVRVYQ